MEPVSSSGPPFRLGDGGNEADRGVGGAFDLPPISVNALFQSRQT